MRHWLLLILFLPMLAAATNVEPVRLPQSPEPSLPLLDLSGMAWVEGNRFLVVHDSKNPEERERKRLSFVWLPNSAAGLSWKSIDPDWNSPLGISNDLESIARIPDTDLYLMVESGEGRFQGQVCQRVFLTEVKGESVRIVGSIALPVPVHNVEGSVVMRFGEQLFFLFAERADHQVYTDVWISELRLDPLRLGAPRLTRYRPRRFTGRNWRPVSALELDSRKQLYVASTYDPDDDDGPFHSVIWRVGRVRVNRRGVVYLSMSPKPQQLAVLDGLKVESLAIREERGKLELFAGTDDENYGAVLRRIPLQP